MGCEWIKNCGGCRFRDLTLEQYRDYKINKFRETIKNGLKISDDVFDPPVFIQDGTRRRSSFAFEYKKSVFTFGFNENKSSTIADCTYCPMLTQKINNNLVNIRKFLLNLCKIAISKKGKGKKIINTNISGGDLLVLEAQNGLDIVLETSSELDLNHRMEIFEFVNKNEDIIRFSHRKDAFREPELIVEKLKPIIKISDYDVYVAAGTFLQASVQGEKALLDSVIKYVGQLKGNIADLFCGIGTFTYPLAKHKANKIVAIDVNQSLLDGFRTSVNKQMLHNVEIVERNLFKYPLEATELEKFDVVIFDPPRAGANALVKQLALVDKTKSLKKVIAVSCNPYSFINDAKVLLDAGYKLENITMVDQFVYSAHLELVALFTTN